MAINSRATTRDSVGQVFDPWILLIFSFGFALSVVMAWNSYTSHDQILLLARGWQLAFEGDLVFVGMPMSGGGFVPGALTSLLVGVPLMAWSDPRAPSFLVLGLHAVAYLLLDRVVARTLGAEERRLFALLFWLNPWRLYHSASLWTPNLLVVLGAVHFWTMLALRKRPRFWPSLLHVLLLGAAAQIHPSVLLLVVASGVLWMRGLFRLNFLAVGLAALLIGLSLVPWLALVIADPGLLPLQGDRPYRLLQPLHGLLRGIGYWLRLSSFYVSGTIRCLDFSALIGPVAWRVLKPATAALLALVGAVSLLLPLWSNYRFWRRPARRRVRLRGSGRSGRAWVESVARWTFLAAVVVFVISPTTIMSWQALGLLHATVLVSVLQLGILLRSQWQASVRRAVSAYGVAACFLCLLVAFGSPIYRSTGDRCGNLNAMLVPLRSDHRMFDDLNLRRDPELRLDAPGGKWPFPLEEGYGVEAAPWVDDGPEGPKRSRRR